MGKKLISDSILTNIGNAIRNKLNTVRQYSPSEMAAAILSIPQSGGGGITPSGTLEVTQNHSQTDCTQYAQVNVDIPDPTGVLPITQNGVTNVLGYGSVNVAVPVGVIPEGTLDIHLEGTYDVSEYEYAEVHFVSVGSNSYLWDDDVVFIDLSGKPVYAMTFSEILAASSLPSTRYVPEIGSAGNWNYTLSDLKSLANKGLPVVVGCQAGWESTKFIFDARNVRNVVVPMYINCTNFTGYVYHTHDSGNPVLPPPSEDFPEYYEEYSGVLNVGVRLDGWNGCRDIVEITCEDGSYEIGKPDGSGFFGSGNQADVGKNLLHAVIISSDCTKINDDCFKECPNLEMVLFSSTNSKGGLTLGDRAIRNCPKLRSIVVPYYVTPPQQAHAIDYSGLEYISLPYNLSSINNIIGNISGGVKKYCLTDNISSLPDGCISGFGLTEFTVPDSITSISYLGGLQGLLKLHIKNSTTLVNLTSYLGWDVSSLLKIFVPQGWGNTYKNATNWSQYASQIYEES